MVPPRHYCVILNPVVRAPDDMVQFDGVGQARLRHADLEIRLAQDPFPLYPGEELRQVRRRDCLYSAVRFIYSKLYNKVHMWQGQ